MAAVLCSCVSVHTQTTTRVYKKKPVSVRQNALRQLTNWLAEGAFSIQRNNKALLANYQWQQDGKSYVIHLAGALNMAATSLRGRPGFVVMQQGGKRDIQSVSPEKLMDQQLGWYVPVTAMRYWIKGIAAPGPAKTKHDKYGHLLSLQQQGWHIAFAKYQTVGPYDLPKLLKLNRPGLAVKLVIKQWRKTSK